MGAVTFAGRYSAVRDGVRVGPFAAGDVVDLDDELADWIARDAPGVIAVPSTDPEPVRVAEPAEDRMVRSSRKRGAS